MNISTRSEMNVNACFSANAFKKFLSRIAMMLSLFVLVNAQGWGQTTVTYAQRIAHYNAGTVFTVGTAGAFNQGSHQVGMYANGGATKQVVAWRTLKTAGDNTGSNRSLQVGDEFRISVSANTVVGEMGFALLSSPSSRSSWNDRLNNAAVSVRLSNYGNWYATYSDGTTANAATSTGSNDIGGNTSYKNFVFTCLLTAPNRMNITITDGTTTSNLNDVLLNNSNAITEYSIFLSDDWNGVQHRDIYWNTNAAAASDFVRNTLTMPIGGSNGSFSISGVLPNGLAANSTSTASVNALTKSGSGSLTLSGNNTYTGTTTISAGTLLLGATGSGFNTPLGTTAGATTVSSGGVLDLNGFNLVTAEGLTINGTGISSGGALINSSGTSAIYSGTVALASNASIGGSGNTTISGAISGANNLTKVGAGTLTLSTTNSFGGSGKSLTIAAGTVAITSFTNNLGDALNTVTLGTASTAGTLEFTPSTGNVSRSFTVAAGGGTLKNLGSGVPTFAHGSGAYSATLNGNLTLNCSSTGDMIFNMGISGAGGIIVNSSGSGRVLLQPASAGTSTYTGSTTITAGSLYLQGANLVSNSSNLILNGGTFGTGVSVGFSETLGTLQLTANSTIALGTGSHTLTFSASNGESWTAGRTLTITGWAGTSGAAGTAGRIFVGSTSSGLTSTQLAQITFNGYGPATILSTGEIVPTATLYRSVTSGNWNSTSTWQSSTDGTTWGSAASTPSSTDGSITIRNGHTVTITAAVSIDEVTVDNGGIVVHSGAGTVTLANGTGTDLTINGTWRRTVSSHTIDQTSGGTISVGSTGIYEHELAAGGGSIPTASWNSTSILRIENSGSTSSSLTNLGQTFGILEINTTTHTDAFLIDGITDVTNEFRVLATGGVGGNVYLATTLSITGGFVQSGGRFIANVNAADRSLTIGGGLTISGGTFEVSGTSGSAIHQVIVNGNILVSGGTLDVNKSASTSGRLMVKGNLTLQSGSIIFTQAGTSGSSGIYFDGTTSQTFTHSGGTLSTASGSAGRRFYYKTSSGPTALNEVYSSSSAQSTILGSEGTPAAGYAAWPTANTILTALTINNSAGVTLSSNKLFSGTVTLSGGSLNLGGNTLTLSSGAAQSVAGGGSNSFNVTNGTVSLTGSASRTITLSGFGTSSSGGLTLGTDVTLQMNSNAALNCGGNGTTTSMLTVLGAMIMNSGTASNIDGGKPPFYGNASTLEYRVSYNVFDEWKSGTAITTPGVPQNVTINGSGITVTTPASERNVKGNLLISAGNFTLNGTVGGDLKVAGNITNNATFTHNDRAVYLNGASAQTLNGTLNGTTTTNCFPYLFIDNTSGGITLNTPVNVTNTLTLTSGVVTTTSTNILHIRNTAAGAMAGGSSSSYISGPLRWSVSNGSGGDYKFHVGKSSTYLPLNINNPTGTSPVITAEAFAANAGGTAGSGLSSLSTSEYWSVVNTGTLTTATISLAKSSLGGRDGIGSSTTLAGTYTNLGGAVTSTLISSNTVTAGTTVGSLSTITYFVLGTKVAAPTVTSFTPSSGHVGSTISITGTNLTGATAVTIGGVAAAGFTVNSATSISATVSAGGATGTISVTTPGGTATSSSSFTFNGYISTQNGDWNSTSTWLGGAVPATSSTVTIDHAVTVNTSVTNAPATVTINSTKSLTFGASGALTATTVTNGGSLVMTAGGTLTIASGGTLANGTSTFTRGSGTIAFAGSGTISGTIGFNNVTLAGGVNFGTTSTIHGTLTINSGGFVSSNAPTYANTSTLRYNSGGTYGRGTEWSATTGAGYPNNVQISNSTTLNLGANSGTGTARQLAGNLTVDALSTLTMNASGEVMTQALTVKGNYINNGTTTLSSSIGGDLVLEGDLTDNATFTANGRAIFFRGSNSQSITSSTNPLDIDVMRIEKSGGEIQLLQNLLVDETADPIQFAGTSSILNLNGYTATFGKSGTASTITMNSTSAIKGSSTSSLIVLGTGAAGTIRFDQTTPGTTNVLQNLTINRTSTGSVTLGNSLRVAGTLTLTDGTLAVGANTLTYSGSSITRTSGTIDASNASATLTFANTSAVTLPASVFTGNVNNLTMNGTGGITLGSATTVAGTLTLTTGNIITTSTNTLTLSNSATGSVSGGNSSSYVEGPLDRTLANATNYTYPVGGATNYRPIILQSVVATGNPVVRVTMAETGATTGDGASIEATLLSARNWRLQTISGTFTSATLNITETALVNGTHEIAKSNSTQAGTYVSAGTGQTVSGGAVTSPSGQTAGYYAIGVAKTYGVTYDANGGTGSQSDATAYAYNASVTVKNAGTMTRTGYTFSGWNTASNGSGTSRAVASTFSITTDVTLYAQWTVNSYTLSYNGNGNTSGTAPSSTSVNYLASTTVSGNTGSLAKTGFTFAGWNTASDGSGDNYAGGSSFTMSNAANVTLYAQWSTGTFEVDYDGNGATGGSVPASGNFAFGATVTVSGNTGTLVRTGYTFAGWNTAANGSGTSYSGGGTFSMPGNNLTLFAQWTVNSYTLTYSTNSATSGTAPSGGSVNYNALVTVAGNTGSLARTGYTFGGWNTAANGSGTTYEGGNTFNMPAANTTLYAKWDINSYTVTYDGNGQTSGTAPASANYNYNATVTVSANSGSLAKTGFLFGGWNTASDGSGTTYTAGSGTFSMGTANVTLYAKWNSASSENSADFRSNGAVSFSSAANWQYDAGGGNWTTATQAPGSGNNVTITHAATMDADYTINSGKTLLLSTGGSLVINPTRTLTVAGTANFGGRPVTLKSTSAGTAAIGQVTGTLSNATNVTVERYMTARRKWRALTAPLTGASGNSIYDNWQNGGSVAGNTGAIIWTSGGTLGTENGTTGLANGGFSTSMLSLNTATNTWSQVSSTKAAGSLYTATQNNAYMLYFTGPYNQSGTYITSGTAASTLSATGTLRTGNVNFSSLGTGWHMIGNPYASSIRTNALSRTNLNTGGYIWNTNGSGTGVFTPLTLSTTTVIQSGQAFFVYSNGAGSLGFTEAAKVSGSSNSLFRTDENSFYGDLKIELNKYVAGKAELNDVAIVNYKSRTEAGLPKLAQFFENISIYQDNTDYGMTTRTLNNGEDQIQLRLWQMDKASYQIKIDLSSMRLPIGSTAILVDAFLNKETPLSTTEANKIDFSVDAKAATSGQRFRIVLRRAATPTTNVDELRNIKVFPNPVLKGGSMQLEFSNQESGNYQITVFSITGAPVQKEVLRHKGGNVRHAIQLDQRLSSGSYWMEVKGDNGTKKQIKLTVQ